MSGKFLYLEIVPGQNLQKLLRPGRVCLENGQCGWLVIRKRRNAWYVYLDMGQGKEAYLGPVARFQPVPVSLIIRIENGKLTADINSAPCSPAEIIGVAKSLSIIADSLSQVGKLLNQVLVKYKLR